MVIGDAGDALPTTTTRRASEASPARRVRVTAIVADRKRNAIENPGPMERHVIVLDRKIAVCLNPGHRGIATRIRSSSSSRRQPMQRLMVLPLVLTLGFGPCAALLRAADARRPNILFIF